MFSAQSLTFTSALFPQGSHDVNKFYVSEVTAGLYAGYYIGASTGFRVDAVGVERRNNGREGRIVLFH